MIGKEEYEFGDLTKKAVSNFTGKEEYEVRTLQSYPRPRAYSRLESRCPVW